MDFLYLKPRYSLACFPSTSRNNLISSDPVWVSMISTCRDFFCQTVNSPFQGLGKGIIGSTMNVVRRRWHRRWRNFLSSLMPLTMLISWMESIQKTLVKGWLPNCLNGHLLDTACCGCRGHELRISLCMAIRLRSRRTHLIIKLEKLPEWQLNQHPTGHADDSGLVIRSCEPHPRSLLDNWLFPMASTLAPWGGPSSPVKAKCPASKIFSRLFLISYQQPFHLHVSSHRNSYLLEERATTPTPKSRFVSPRPCNN